jgi:hypothetical protein
MAWGCLVQRHHRGRGSRVMASSESPASAAGPHDVHDRRPRGGEEAATAGSQADRGIDPSSSRLRPRSPQGSSGTTVTEGWMTFGQYFQAWSTLRGRLSRERSVEPLTPGQTPHLDGTGATPRSTTIITDLASIRSLTAPPPPQNASACIHTEPPRSGPACGRWCSTVRRPASARWPALATTMADTVDTRGQVRVPRSAFRSRAHVPTAGRRAGRSGRAASG